jgi:peptidoglycan/LPS O-acetylase OafA/YrhL/lysophospholipase L1-like esterase
MPEPTVRGERYAPGLDGLRAVAVLAVIAYHFGFSWAPGGLLGVGVFFTLSGYLITDLLLDRWIDGGAPLVDFWRRRARRLLPAVFVMLAVVGAWVALEDRSMLAQTRGGIWSALLYVNNWWQIAEHQSYFARFGPTPPLQHLWSLAVEEQFYLLWPWLLLGGVALVREHGAPARLGPLHSSRFTIRPRLAVLTLLLAGASALEMALLYRPSLDPTRLYEGTDTRAFGLLFGAALAMLWPLNALGPRIAPGARRILEVGGIAGLAAIVAMIWSTDQYSSFLYEGGLVLLSAATVLVIAAAAHPSTWVGRVLGAGPLRWLGERSYGIYLWHLPIIALTTPALAAPSYTRALWQLALTIALAALSWRFIEAPVRRGALGRIAARARRHGIRAIPVRARLLGVLSVACAAAAVVIVLVANPAPLSAAQPGSAQLDPASLPSPATSPRRSGPSPVSRVVAGDPARTSCRTVAHLGDSTSDGLDSPNYLPDPAWRMPAQYARVGVRRSVFEIDGGDSIVEHLQGQPDMAQLASSLVHSGYRGCWVLALGTNDTADVAVGSNVNRAQRIARMMRLAGSEPVMWVNVRTLLSSGPYAESNMSAWNAALIRACRRYPNLRVFDWASIVKPSWFIADGIHYGTPGYRWRARLIADALARAFPAGGRSTGCLVELPHSLLAGAHPAGRSEHRAHSALRGLAVASGRLATRLRALLGLTVGAPRRAQGRASHRRAPR